MDSAIFPISEDKIRRVIERGCQQDKKYPCIIGIIEGLERIEASVCLDSAQPWYSDAWLLQDKWIHVHYLHRRSRHIFRLMAFVHRVHEQTGAVVCFGIETTKDLARKYRFYRRHAPCFGAAFALGIKGGDGQEPPVLE
jgi:hypothetical protein